MTINHRVKKCILFVASICFSVAGMSQTYTGLFRTSVGNTGYHQFNRNGGGAAVYINQEAVNQPILRLSSGTATANAGVVFTVENNGSVGIGTITPKAKLAVNGNILATEVKIKTDINVPDYVFASGYPLMSLPEIERYVKQHKHLPEVPSAAEIETDGLDVAAMNLLLLKKIEELTLHLIEKDKKMQDMEDRLKQLEK